MSRAQRDSSFGQINTNKFNKKNKDDIRRFKCMNNQLYDQKSHLFQKNVGNKMIKVDGLETKVISSLKRKESIKNLDLDDMLDNVNKNQQNCLSQDSLDVDIDKEIDDIKNRRYFVVPKKLAADRYVNMFKMIVKKKGKITFKDFKELGSLDIIQPNIEYLHFDPSSVSNNEKIMPKANTINKEDEKRRENKLEKHLNDIYHKIKNLYS
mmetsp:Transcript_24464/g.21724  ORF Transcript_24464/g.21724 Transcript_24464/m.21724 type:complete len:209 (+) Transcript_24464:443-1069(+)